MRSEISYNLSNFVELLQSMTSILVFVAKRLLIFKSLTEKPKHNFVTVRRKTPTYSLSNGT